MQTVSLPPLELSDGEWAVLPLPSRLVVLAEQELAFGLVESPRGSDRGPRVDAILRAARSTPGRPWSAAFVCWLCLWSSWTPISDVPDAGVMYPGSVASWATWARRRSRLKEGAPRVGDLYFFDRPGAAHMGIVTAVKGATFCGIAGDSNGDLPGEGTMVAREHHRIGDPTGFITLDGIPCR